MGLKKGRRGLLSGKGGGEESLKVWRNGRLDRPRWAREIGWILSRECGQKGRFGGKEGKKKQKEPFARQVRNKTEEVQ